MKLFFCLAVLVLLFSVESKGQAEPPDEFTRDRAKPMNKLTEGEFGYYFEPDSGACYYSIDLYKQHYANEETRIRAFYQKQPYDPWLCLEDFKGIDTGYRLFIHADGLYCVEFSTPKMADLVVVKVKGDQATQAVWGDNE